MDKETIKAHKISDEEYEQILEILGREPIIRTWGYFCDVERALLL